MQEGMTNDQLNTMLETIAKLIEAQAKTPQEAAQIVRNAKTKENRLPSTYHSTGSLKRTRAAWPATCRLYYTTRQRKIKASPIRRGKIILKRLGKGTDISI